MVKSLALSQYRLFIGHPGVGKSTLADCVAGRLLFKSGLTFGSGTTYRLEKEIHGGIMYLNTPGLADICMQSAAASAITEALSQNGKYQIFFVITLSAGRFRPQDLETIWLVLLNAPDINCFNIIINKCSKSDYNDFRNENNQSILFAALEFMGVHKYKVLVLPRNNILEDADNQIVDFPELVTFVEAAQWVYINSSNVSEIPHGRD